jgi:hypothetical protein
VTFIPHAETIKRWLADLIAGLITEKRVRVIQPPS